MKSLVGIISVLVFLVIAYFAAGSYIDSIKTKNQANCTDASITLGLCTPNK